RGEPGVDLAPHALDLALELGHLARVAAVGTLRLELLDALLELDHRLLEIQPDAHGAPLAQRARSDGKRALRDSSRVSPADTQCRGDRLACRERSGMTMCRYTSHGPGCADNTSSTCSSHPTESSSARTSRWSAGRWSARASSNGRSSAATSLIPRSSRPSIRPVTTITDSPSSWARTASNTSG